MRPLTRSERRAHAKQIKARFADELREIPKSEWPTIAGRPPLRVLASRTFLVMIYAEEHALCRISVCRTTLERAGRWADGISWDELQELKRQVGHGDDFAVEVYPPDADVVNVANIRHLFVIHPSAAPFAWRKKGET